MIIAVLCYKGKVQSVSTAYWSGARPILESQERLIRRIVIEA